MAGEEGQDLLEYALLIVLIVLVAAAFAIEVPRGLMAGLHRRERMLEQRGPELHVLGRQEAFRAAAAQHTS